MSKYITGPLGKITNLEVDLGPRILMVGNEVLGSVENMSIEVAESTEEELEKLKSANEIRLVKMLGESNTFLSRTMEGGKSCQCGRL